MEEDSGKLYTDHELLQTQSSASILSLVLFFTLAFAFLITPTSVFACSPSQFKSYTVADHVKAAEVVLEGMVTAELPQQKIPVKIPGLNNLITTDEVRVVSVKVERYFKGNGLSTVTISGFGEGIDCLSLVYVGDHLIFYASANSDKGLLASYLLVSDATAPAESATISEVMAATGQNPALPVEASPTPAATATQAVTLASTPAPKSNQISPAPETGQNLELITWLLFGLLVVAFIVSGITSSRKRKKD